MPKSPELITEIPKVEKEITPEKEKEMPHLTVYLLRHGESGKDKTDPKRGLTDNGENQVKEAFSKILDQILAEENPDFEDWDNPEAKKEALSKALQNIEIHLRDSGTDRTFQQEWIEKEMLDDLGVEEVYIPKAAYEWKEEVPPPTAGPGIKKRLRGVGGLSEQPEFRKLIDNPEYQKKVGATDALIAWALTPEDEIPKGVETRRQMVERYKKDLASVNRVAERLEKYPKRVVVVANSHASIITVAASAEFGIPMERLGEVENAEGIRMDFYGGDKAYKVQPVGEKIEKKVEDIKSALDIG